MKKLRHCHPTYTTVSIARPACDARPIKPASAKAQRLSTDTRFVERRMRTDGGRSFKVGRQERPGSGTVPPGGVQDKYHGGALGGPQKLAIKYAILSWF